MHAFSHIADPFVRKCAARSLNSWRVGRNIARKSGERTIEEHWTGKIDGFRDALYLLRWADVPLTNPAQDADSKLGAGVRTIKAVS